MAKYLEWRRCSLSLSFHAPLNIFRPKKSLVLEWWHSFYSYLSNCKSLLEPLSIFLSNIYTRRMDRVKSAELMHRHKIRHFWHFSSSNACINVFVWVTVSKNKTMYSILALRYLLLLLHAYHTCVSRYTKSVLKIAHESLESVSHKILTESTDFFLLGFFFIHIFFFFSWIGTPPKFAEHIPTMYRLGYFFTPPPPSQCSIHSYRWTNKYYIHTHSHNSSSSYV